MNTTRNRLTPSSRSARILLLLLSGLICAVAGGAGALAQQCTPTVKTDRGIYTEPALPALPAAGGKFCDPTFGTQIMRATDQNDCPAPGCGTYYSHWPTFNSNNTYILFRTDNNGNSDGLIKQFDPVNFTVTGPSFWPGTIYFPGVGGVVMQFESAIWHPTDPHLIYTFPKSEGSPVPMGLYTFDVVSKTYSASPVKDFSAYRQSPSDFLAQMSMSADGNVFAFNIRNYEPGNTKKELPVAYLIWNKATNAVIYQAIPNQDVNEVRIDKSGTYLGIGKEFPPCSQYDPPCEFVKGQYLNVATMQVQDLLWNGTDNPLGHGDVGTRKTAGFAPFGGGIRVRSLDNLYTSLVVAFDWKTGPGHWAGEGHVDWTKDFHGSFLADDESWMTIGTYLDWDAMVGDYPQTDYQLLNNEIVQVSMDGSQRIKRLAHTRSVVRADTAAGLSLQGIAPKPSNDSYWSSPKPTISKDGRFIAFTSNWGNSDRYDLFILKVPQGSGNSLSLDGVDDYMQAPDSDSLDVHNSPFTVEAWVKYNSTGVYQTIVGKESHGQTGGGGGYELSITNLGKARLNIWTDSATYVAAIGATTITTGVWHHIAAVADGSQRRIYLDGVLDTSVNGATLPQAGNGTFNVGRRGNNSYRFGGLIDEVRVSNAALYASNFTPETSLTSDAATTRGLWKFDGQTANDSSANANNGTLQGGATYSADVPVASFYSLLLNGTDASVQAPDSNSLDVAGSPFTVEAWVKYNSNGNNQTIIGKESHGVSTGGGGYELSITNLGKARLNIWTAYNVYVAVIGTTTLTPDVWHHIAAVADGSQRRIYLDGVLDATATGTQLPAAGTGTFNIGRRSNNTYRFDGRVDEVRVSNTAVYTSNFTPLTSLTGSASTKGLWKFDNQTAADDSGNGNHGTTQGGVVYSTDVP
jgi:hypothetical protein